MIERIEGVLYMDGYDDCLLGHIERCGSKRLALYDYTKLVIHHMRDDMTHSEAVEFVEYNQLGAYMGDDTPYFLLPEEPK